MQEVFEKIKGRLNTERGRYWNDNSEYGTGKWSGIDEAMDIVDQVAEEYQECALCYFGNPCEYQNKDVRMPESELNNGWIPCGERLPDTEHKPHKPVLVQLKMSMVVGYANSAGQWFADCGDGCSLDVTDEAIAWRPLPGPYRGE